MKKPDAPREFSATGWEEIFGQLSIVERIEIVRLLLSGIERDLHAPKLESPAKAGAATSGMVPPYQSTTPSMTESEITDLDNAYAEYDPSQFITGAEAPIHRQRLEDAVGHLRGLLKKYGYVKGLTPTHELARKAQRQLEEEEKKRSRGDSYPPAWSSWVAKEDESEDGD